VVFARCSRPRQSTSIKLACTLPPKRLNLRGILTRKTQTKTNCPAAAHKQLWYTWGRARCTRGPPPLRACVRRPAAPRCSRDFFKKTLVGLPGNLGLTAGVDRLEDLPNLLSTSGARKANVVPSGVFWDRARSMTEPITQPPLPEPFTGKPKNSTRPRKQRARKWKHSRRWIRSLRRR
jgi:hypothetical protein